jgi:hypothetical protein
MIGTDDLWAAVPLARPAALVFIAVTAVFVVYVTLSKSKNAKCLNLPVVGNPSDTDFRQAMEEGTRKVNCIYVLSAL